MTCAQNESVTVQPFWIGRINIQRRPKEHGTDLSRAERETEVAGGTFVDGVHGEATGFIGSFLQECLVHR